MAPQARCQKQSGSPLNVWEKTKLFCLLARISSLGIYYMLAGLFRGSSGAKKYRLHVGRAMLRSLTSRLDWKQLQFLWPSTDLVYEQYAKDKGFSSSTVELEHGGLGHWLGDESANVIVLYFHGGGFQLSANPVLLDFCAEIIMDLNSQGHNVAFFFLTYTLTPHASYPTQLKQGVEALRYIIKQTGRSPSNIILGGDSAGGNLALSVLLHLSRPHPDIERLEISEPLRGIYAISPWGCLDLDGWPSVQDNAAKDIFSKEAGHRWANAYLNGRQSDYWSDPFICPVEWWGEVKVEQVLILTGSEDLLLSQIQDFVLKMKNEVRGTTFVIGLHEGHVSPIFDRVIGEKSKTKQETGLRRWLADILKRDSEMLAV